MINREEVIRNYIDGYNKFDIEKVIKDFDEEIIFENILNGETNMLVMGVEAFKEQEEQAKSYFSTRTQSIRSFRHQAEETEIQINYYAILAMDFPDGLKKGHELKLEGRSVFKFSNDKVVKLTDVS